VLLGLAVNTGLKVGGVFNAIERIISPDKLSALSAERISHFVKVLRSEEMEVEKERQMTDDEGREVTERVRKTVIVKREEATINGPPPPQPSVIADRVVRSWNFPHDCRRRPKVLVSPDLDTFRETQDTPVRSSIVSSLSVTEASIASLARAFGKEPFK
jgi:hypothetical protein